MRGSREVASCRVVLLLGLAWLASAISASALRILAFGTFSDSTNNPPTWTTNENYKSLTTIFPLAIDQFNNRSGAVIPELPSMLAKCPSTRIELVRYANDANGQQRAMEELVKLLAQRTPSDNIVDAVIGPIRSAITQPVSSAANALQIPVLSHWSTSTALSNKLNYPLFARTTPTDEGVALAMADLFVEFGYTRVGLIYLDDPYGNAWKNALFNACERERNIRLVTVLFDDSSDSVDNAVRSMQTEGVNIIVYIFLSDETLTYFALAAVKNNMLKGRLWVSTISNLDITMEEASPETQKAVDEFLKGSLHVIASVPGVISVPGIPFQRNEYWENLIRVWSTLSVTEIGRNFPTPFRLPEGYFSPSQVAQQVVPVWSWAFDAVLAFGLAACECAAQGLTDGCSTDPLKGDGNVFFQTLVHNHFKGVSGQVAFLPTGDRDPSTSAYLLKNARPAGSGLINPVVGTWSATSTSGGVWTLLKAQFYLGVEGSPNPPPDTAVPFHDIQLLPIWAKAMGYTETCIVLLFVLWSFGFVLVHRQQPIIVKSQPHFLCLMNLGCAIMGSSIIPLTLDDSSSCMAFPWLFGVGFTLSLSALGAKSWRVYFLWRNPGFFKTRRARKGTFYLGLITLIVLIEIGLLISWTAVAPLRYVIVTTLYSEKNKFPLVSYGTCLGDFPASAIFLGLLLSLNAIVLLGTIYISHLVKNAPEEFHEAHSTFIAGFAVSGVYFVGIPTVAALYSNPIGRFIGLSSIAFLTSLALLLAMYIPRVMAIRTALLSPPVGGSRSSDETKGSPKGEGRPLNNNDPNAKISTPILFRRRSAPLQDDQREILFSRAKAVLDQLDDTARLRDTEPSSNEQTNENPPEDSNRETIDVTSWSNFETNQPNIPEASKRKGMDIEII